MTDTTPRDPGRAAGEDAAASAAADGDGVRADGVGAPGAAMDGVHAGGGGAPGTAAGGVRADGGGAPGTATDGAPGTAVDGAPGTAADGVPGTAAGGAPTATAEAKPDRRPARLAELLALTGFAFAQPVLDVTGRSPDFFLYRRPSTLEVVALLAIVALVPPLLMWLAECLVGLVSRTAERALHLLFVAGLLTVLAVQIGKQSGFYGRRLAAVALVAGCAVAVLVARSLKVRQVLRYASPAPLVFVLVFALTAPAGALLRPAREGASLGTTAGKRPPIVVLFLDEFPTGVMLDKTGRIDRRLFPNLAKLADETTWYPNATGVSGYTPYAIPAMLTGKFPKARLAPAYVEYPDSLFSLLGDAYQVNAFESISQVCPPSVCTENAPAGRATGLRPLLDDTAKVAREVVSPRRPEAREGEDFAEQPAERTDAQPTKGELKPGFRLKEGAKNQPDRLTAFLDAVSRPPGDKPALNFLHLLLPHIPHRFVPSGLTYAEHAPSFPLGRAKEGDNFRRNEYLGALRVFEQRILLQLAYTDGLIGQVVDRMKKAGSWDEAVFVLTADHGAGLAPGQKSRLLDTGNVAELAYVPLFVKAPGQQAGRTDERNAMNVDVLPTIADALDVEVPFRVDGVSLLGEPRPTGEKKWFDDPGEAQAVDGPRWGAVVRAGRAHEFTRPELGQEGLFAIGPHRALYGKKLAALTVGPRAPVRATSKHPKGFGQVSVGSGTVPAMLWGDLDRSAGDPEQWLAVSVNGTIGGFAFAAPSRKTGTWHFVGMVADRWFVEGANDVRLHVVDGTTLHPLDWTDG